MKDTNVINITKRKKLKLDNMLRLEEMTLNDNSKEWKNLITYICNFPRKNSLRTTVHSAFSSVIIPNFQMH